MRRSIFSIAPMVFILASATLARGQDVPADPLPLLSAEASDPDLDILTRGPVHEAFAEQTSPDPEPGLTVPQAPPEPIDEIPPDFKPEGDDVDWIPGYWFWDEDRNDYLWVSGVWRRIPPGRRWVPGYWQDQGDQYQWIAGFWSPDTATEVEYLETPPESLETGPSSPAPSDDHFWTPGVWVWNINQYHWQPGYWNAYRDGWTWVSARYDWTPYGCVYVPGYWDYALTLRGHLFAPVYYRTPIYRRPGYFYRPVSWIGYEPLLLHLFARPLSHHLYFGDYYDVRYRHRHFIPYYRYHSHHRGYASLYTYYHHHYRRHGIDYVGRVGRWHDYYSKNVHRRPPHTYGHQARRPTSERRLDQDILARPYARGTGDRIAGRELSRVPQELQQKLRRDSEQVRDLAKARQRLESSDRPAHRQRDGGDRERDGRGRDNIAGHERLKLPLASTRPAEAATRGGERNASRIPSDIARINRHGTRSASPTVRGQDEERDATAARRRPTTREQARDQGRLNQPRGDARDSVRDLTTNDGKARTSVPSQSNNRRAAAATERAGISPSRDINSRPSASDAARLRERSRTTLPFSSDSPRRSSSDSPRRSPSSDSPRIQPRTNAEIGSPANPAPGPSSSRGAARGALDRGAVDRGALERGARNLDIQRPPSTPRVGEPAAGLNLGRQRSATENVPRLNPPTNRATAPPSQLRRPEATAPPAQRRGPTSPGPSGQSPWSKAGRGAAPDSTSSFVRPSTTPSFSNRNPSSSRPSSASTPRRSSSPAGLSGLGNSSRSSSRALPPSAGSGRNPARAMAPSAASGRSSARAMAPSAASGRSSARAMAPSAGSGRSPARAMAPSAGSGRSSARAMAPSAGSGRSSARAASPSSSRSFSGSSFRSGGRSAERPSGSSGGGSRGGRGGRSSEGRGR